MLADSEFGAQLEVELASTARVLLDGFPRTKAQASRRCAHWWNRVSSEHFGRRKPWKENKKLSAPEITNGIKIYLYLRGGESIIIDTTKCVSVFNTRSRTLSYSQSASKAQETFATSNLDGDFGAMTTSFVCKHAMMYKYIHIYRIYIYIYK